MGGSFLYLYDLLLNRIFDQLPLVVQVQLLHQAVAVRYDRRPTGCGCFPLVSPICIDKGSTPHPADKLYQLLHAAFYWFSIKELRGCMRPAAIRHAQHQRRQAAAERDISIRRANRQLRLDALLLETIFGQFDQWMARGQFPGGPLADHFRFHLDPGSAGCFDKPLHRLHHFR